MHKYNQNITNISFKSNKNYSFEFKTLAPIVCNFTKTKIKKFSFINLFNLFIWQHKDIFFLRDRQTENQYVKQSG